MNRSLRNKEEFAEQEGGLGGRGHTLGSELGRAAVGSSARGEAVEENLYVLT